MTTYTQPSVHENETAPEGLVGITAKAAGIAVVLVAAVFALARALGDRLVVTPEFGGSGPEELQLAMVIGATVMGSIAGLVIAKATQRWSKAPRSTFVAVTVTLIVLYGVLAFTSSETVATGVWLNLMHIAVAIPVVGSLARSLDR